jgi:hypothetical protein
MFTTALSIHTLAFAVFAASPPTPARFGSDGQDPPKIQLAVDVSELGADGTGIDGLISDELGPRFAAAGYELVTNDPAAAQVRVRLEVLRLDKFDYGIHFELGEGDQVEPLLPWVACLACMDSKLLTVLDSSWTPLLDTLDEHLEAREPDPRPVLVSPLDTSPTESTRPIGPLGYVGIGIGVLGLGGVVWGAVDLSRGRVYDSPPDAGDLYRTGTDHTFRGKVLLGAGAGVVVVGGALLITDLMIHRKRRAQATSRAHVPAPFISPTAVGLAWTGRF